MAETPKQGKTEKIVYKEKQHLIKIHKLSCKCILCHFCDNEIHKMKKQNHKVNIQIFVCVYVL